MTITAPFKILFLCTGNSARSILCEYLIRFVAPGRFESYSAGSEPSGTVDPLVLQVLKNDFKADVSEARSKSLEEYRETPFDFVITVCDAQKETCPTWPGQPVLAHWNLPDPEKFQGSAEDKVKLIFQVALQVQRRLEMLCSLPLEKMEHLKKVLALEEIDEKHRS